MEDTLEDDYYCFNHNGKVYYEPYLDYDNEYETIIERSED